MFSLLPSISLPEGASRLIAATALLAALATSLHAESPAYCSDYAQEAVADAQRNLQHACRYGGARWSLNYDVHYSWCLKTVRPDAVAERAARRNGMIACLGHP